MADTSLAGRLKNLFSTNVVVRQVGKGKGLRVADTDHVQAYSIQGKDRYSRIFNPMSGFGMMQGGGLHGQAMAYQSQRLELFRDYDVMDNDPIIASALDIYSDESSLSNEFGEILTINSVDAEIKDILHNLFYDILNIEFNLWPWIRNLCKYGDFFLYLEISEKYGIHNVMPMSVYETMRIEGEDPNNPYLVKFRTTGTTMPKAEFDNFEIAHFRLLSDSNFLPYGKSMIESGRRVWKQLTLMEDAMMIHRIMRAPEKRVFKIDIGNIAPNEVDSFMELTISKMKKAPLEDPRTGQLNLRYNMQNMTEDFYLPVRGSESGMSIDSLKGLEFNGIEDINYIKAKIFAALKIPKAFLGYDESVSGKLTLAAEDVRFSRTIERIQRILVSELTKIAIVHLYAQGFDDERLVDFDLQLTNPSTIAEQEKISLWKEKVDLATAVQAMNLIGSHWIYDNIFEMPKDEQDEQRVELVMDKKRAFRYTQIEQQGQDPAKAAPAHPANVGIGPQAPEDGQQPQQAAAPQNEQNPVGRPEEGQTYDQDSHPRGRDPLGHAENTNAMKAFQQRSSPKRKGFAREAYGLDKFERSIDKISFKEPSFLNEEVLLEIPDDEES